MNEQLSLSSKANLHTVNGEFIQIRTKDSKSHIHQCILKNMVDIFQIKIVPFISNL